MVDEGRVARLLRGIDERVTRLDDQRDLRQPSTDPLWLDGIKYNFVTAIEGCIDVAHHIAAAERWQAPDDNAAAFTLLADHEIIDGHLARRMAQAVGFRNVLVHEYARVDDDRVVGYLDELDDFRSYVRQISRWLTEQT